MSREEIVSADNRHILWSTCGITAPDFILPSVPATAQKVELNVCEKMQNILCEREVECFTCYLFDFILFLSRDFFFARAQKMPIDQQAKFDVKKLRSQRVIYHQHSINYDRSGVTPNFPVSVWTKMIQKLHDFSPCSQSLIIKGGA